MTMSSTIAEQAASRPGVPAGSPERNPQMSIYDNIGGAPAVRAAVDDFYARVLADARLAPFFTGTDLHRLKAHQRAFLAAAIGGPEIFAGRDMAAAHAGLGIGDGDFDAVVAHLAGTLTRLGVPQDTTGQIARALAPLRDDIVTTPRAGPAGGSRDANAVYSLGSSQAESARLLRQADELTPESQMLLDRAGVRPGQAAADLGCGPRGALELLAARVSPGGRVVGIDADPAHVAMAAAFAAERGLDGVKVMAADARQTGLPSGSFDLVHTRTLLVNVPEPARVVAEMVRLARPGGVVAAMEPDCEYELCYPRHPAMTRIREIFPVVFARNGADPHIGRRVPELFRHAGLADVAVEAAVRVYPKGHSRRTILLDLVQGMRPQVLELGLASGAELDELDAAARAHLDDPHTVAMSHPFFLTWGHKPA
jgi:truncated hemoglobin YjbI/SAM-dependent methyltransferase